VTEAITLRAEDLFSKSGFLDGDLLGEIWPALDYPLLGQAEPSESDVLVRLVETYLLPALPVPVPVERYATCHNPIRAEAWPNEEACRALLAQVEHVEVDITAAQVAEVIERLRAEA
jgi:hypothetical protein